MDPLSIISGIAGVATAGSVLSGALFNLISTIHSAPREMTDIARGICDLSLVLHRLLRAIKSAIRRIRHIHRDINGLIAGDDGSNSVVRVLWVFRKSKAAALLARIESHKSTVQLMDTGTDNENSTISIRPDAENLVRIAGQSLQGILSGPDNSTCDQSTQTTDTVFVTSMNYDEPCDVPDAQKDKVDGQVQKWDAASDDTAAWLYKLVFSGNEAVKSRVKDGPQDSYRLSTIDGEFTQAQGSMSPPQGVLITTSSDARQVVDRLLRRWTTLTPREIGTIDTKEDENSHKVDSAAKIPEPSELSEPQPTSPDIIAEQTSHNTSRLGSKVPDRKHPISIYPYQTSIGAVLGENLEYQLCVDWNEPLSPFRTPENGFWPGS
ncbi:hypothetical protein VE03_05858 [Pseudogymnoascus sp. 23342-1-I1]|nr:hypothetical protein VE03_05858 [Pseudogymnoascus sp. 23342-1-I1]